MSNFSITAYVWEELGLYRRAGTVELLFHSVASGSHDSNSHQINGDSAIDTTRLKFHIGAKLTTRNTWCYKLILIFF
jgi:hypothetical protein